MENNIYESPKSKLVDDFEPLEDGIIATRWSRFGAYFIDTLIMIVPILLCMRLTGGLDGEEQSVLYSVVIGVMGIVIFLLVHSYFLIRDGQTVGKKVLGIKIVTLDNRLPSIPTLVKRYVFYFAVPSIPYVGPALQLVNVLFIFSQSKRCVHDHFGGTKVVYVNT